jgi:dihydrofolate reductase
MNVKLIAIAALGKNRQIGLKGKLPWNIPEEYDQFLKTIEAQYVLIGRKNFASHKGDVEGAYPLVLSRNPNFSSPNAIVFRNLLDVLTYAQDAEIEKIFVIGGEEIYKLTLPYLNEFIWSEIDYDGEADSFFPDFSNYDWNEITKKKYSKWTLRHLIKKPAKVEAYL